MITWLFHVRAVSLFTILLVIDYLFVKHAWTNLNSRGFSVDIVFGLEVSVPTDISYLSDAPAFPVLVTVLFIKSPSTCFSFTLPLFSMPSCS